MLMFYCPKCAGNAGSSRRACQSCAASPSEPRLGRKTLERARHAFEDRRRLKRIKTTEESTEIAEAKKKRAAILRASYTRKNNLALTAQEILWLWQKAHGKLKRTQIEDFLTHPCMEPLTHMQAVPVRLAIAETPKLREIMRLANAYMEGRLGFGEKHPNLRFEPPPQQSPHKIKRKPSFVPVED